MLLKDNKKGLVTLIMKRMKGGSEDMSPSFGKAESVKLKDGAEQDNSIGLDSAASEMMEAIKSGDPKSFKNSLLSFIEMCKDED